jgi:hypothetical protein
MQKSVSGGEFCEELSGFCYFSLGKKIQKFKAVAEVIVIIF